MKLDQLTKITKRSQKRLGRGMGSGKGKTSGRGTKGQKARGKVALGFIGGTLPFYKKLPFRRGLGNAKQTIKMLPLSLSKLSIFPNDSVVDLQSLIDKKLISDKQAIKRGVKIVGDADIQVKLEVKVPTTAKAAQKIEKAGGKVVRA